MSGHPSTGSSSFTPMGTPPKGRCTSAAAAARRAPSSSTEHTALSSDDATAASDPSSASVGEIAPDRKASTNEHASDSHGSVLTNV